MFEQRGKTFGINAGPAFQTSAPAQPVVNKDEISLFLYCNIKGLLAGIYGEQYLIHLRFAFDLQAVVGNIAGKCSESQFII